MQLVDHCRGDRELGKDCRAALHDANSDMRRAAFLPFAEQVLALIVQWPEEVASDVRLANHEAGLRILPVFFVTGCD